MNKLFYPKLAAQNLHKNRQFYLPYILTVLGTAAAFYILAALANTKPTSTQTRYYYLSIYMSIGLVVVGLFSVIFLFYTNSFLMKRRGKELGLYNVLGMGKRNIAAMLGFETLYVHPTFLYESLWNFVGLIALHIWSNKGKRKYDGQIFWLYILWYGLGRAWIEGLRTDSLYIGTTDIRVSQLLAAVSAIAALVVLIINAKKQHRPEDLFVNLKKGEDNG